MPLNPHIIAEASQHLSSELRDSVNTESAQKIDKLLKTDTSMSAVPSNIAQTSTHTHAQKSFHADQISPHPSVAHSNPPRQQQKRTRGSSTSTTTSPSTSAGPRPYKVRKAAEFSPILSSGVNKRRAEESLSPSLQHSTKTTRRLEPCELPLEYCSSSSEELEDIDLDF